EGEGLPHAAIFRDLDAEGENPATIQRFLDRAAFEAARTGAVVVTGTTSPGTVAALQEWIAAGAKGSVVGPVSAVMLAERGAPAAPVSRCRAGRRARPPRPRPSAPWTCSPSPGTPPRGRCRRRRRRRPGCRACCPLPRRS